VWAKSSSAVHHKEKNMPSTIVADVFRQIDASFLLSAVAGASNLAVAMRPIFNTLVTIYVLLWGFAMWRGLIQEPLSDGVLRILKIVLIGTFALNVGVFSPRIITFIYNTPEQLAAVITPSGTRTGLSTSLDTAIDRGDEVSQAFIAAMGPTSPFLSLGYYLSSIIVAVFTLVLVGFAAALILIAKITMTVVLMFAPLFIVMLIFEPTKNFFQGWLGQALNGLFTYVISAALVVVAIRFFLTAAAAGAANVTGAAAPTFGMIAQMIFVGIAVFAVLMQAGGIASALAGGVQVSTMGMVGWTMNQARSAIGAPVRGARGAYNWNEKRMSQDYYRKQMGRPATVPTRALAWAKQRLTGSNSIKKD
jgi:type IV secretion system protein VirB6